MKLVLLHSLPLDGRMWEAQRGLLPGATVAPCLYRRGASLEQWATGVLAAVDGHDIVVGCSVGGSCAREVARAAPDRVPAIVLVGTKAAVRPEPALRDEDGARSAQGRLRGRVAVGGGRPGATLTPWRSGGDEEDPSTRRSPRTTARLAGDRGAGDGRDAGRGLRRRGR